MVKSLQAGLTKSKDDVSVVSTMEDELASDVKMWIPTGFADLDRVFGGGWPVGRVSEVFGPEASGKSALTHMALRECQRVGGLPIIIDWEGALEKNKMVQLGINEANIVYIKPEHIEQAWMLLWRALDKIGSLPDDAKPTCVLVVWDSIAASICKKQAEDKDGEAFSNFDVAKAMNGGCRKAYLIAPKVNAHFLFVNQERTQIGGFTKGFGGPPKTTPGGDAVKYAASLRVRCQRIGQIKVGARVAGYEIKTSTRKNKCAPPHQSSQWLLDFTVGPSPELTMLDQLIAAKVIRLIAPKKTAPAGPVKKGPVKKSAPASVDDTVFADKAANEVEDEVKAKVKKVSHYSAPWTEDVFVKDEWLGLMKTDALFRKGAKAAFKEVVAGRGLAIDTEEAEASDD